jgi:hypothetical protein
VLLGWLTSLSKSGFDGDGQRSSRHLWRGDVAVARARFEATAQVRTEATHDGDRRRRHAGPSGDAYGFMK